MNLLFAMDHYYLPQFSSGVQSSTHELALHLQTKGVTVSVLANLIGNDWVGFRSRAEMKLLNRKAP
jgi:hypothetical protein